MFTHYLTGVLALSAATGFIFPPAPTKADPPAEPSVKQLLEDIKVGVTGTRNDIAGLKDRLNTLDEQIAEVKRSMVKSADHERLKRELEQLKGDVDGLRAQINGSRPSTSGSSPLPTGPGGPSMVRPLATTGTLHVTNQRPFETEVFVNGTGYIIGAFGSADIPVPAGSFTYSVPGLMAAPVTRVMPGGQVFGIRVY